MGHARCMEVTPGSAADLAGIRVGDFIVSAAGRPVELQPGSAAHPPAAPCGRSGDHWTIWRDGERLEVTLILQAKEEAVEQVS